MNQAELHHLLATESGAKTEVEQFEIRLYSNLTLIRELFFYLYPEETHQPEFKKLVHLLSKLFSERPDYLTSQDVQRAHDIDWYKSQDLVGMQLYVDLFNQDINGLIQKLDYFEELGVNLLHLMPITTRPKDENDGGYAVNSYTEIDAKYGTKKDFDELTKQLRKRKIHLMLDFVANHTSDEHEWALAAKAGQPKYQDYYHTFANRSAPDVYERTLQEVFPETAPGNFTYIPEMERWVMTVFNTYQWDLNYKNPEVFLAMLTNLVELSNMGADVIRLDALAFLWKKVNTSSQNLPEAHKLISLFRLCLQVIAPGSILLAEAIVAPEEIVKYFGEGNRTGNECEIAYNASLMSLLWNSIATKKSRLLYKSVFNLPSKPKSATWINYIRCHDDIGLGISDRLIHELGWNAWAHRKFLLEYYCQKLEWSPAKGMLFMYNPKTGDGRISGSAASLLGLEKGIEENDQKLIQQSIDKIIMMHGIILSFGGIPMIYAGDELGTTNDYSYAKQPDQQSDNRWVNRPFRDWKKVAERKDNNSISSAIFNRLKDLINIRKQEPALADHNNLVFHYSGNDHLFMFERPMENGRGILIVSNFDEEPHPIQTSILKQMGYVRSNNVLDLVSDHKLSVGNEQLIVASYQILWLKK